MTRANVAGILSPVTEATLGALVGEVDRRPMDHSRGRMSARATGTAPPETVGPTTLLAVPAASSVVRLRMT